MQPSTSDPTPYTMEGLLRFFMGPHSHRVIIVLSLEDVQHVWKVSWLWWCLHTVLGIGGAVSHADAWKKAFVYLKEAFG